MHPRCWEAQEGLYHLHTQSSMSTQSREEEDTVSGLRPIMVIVSLPLGPAAPASEIDRRVPQGRHNLILHHQYAFNTCLHIGIYDVYTSGMHTCLHMGATPLSCRPVVQHLHCKSITSHRKTITPLPCPVVPALASTSTYMQYHRCLRNSGF